jgi:hypothetical protein
MAWSSDFTEIKKYEIASKLSEIMKAINDRRVLVNLEPVTFPYNNNGEYGEKAYPSAEDLSGLSFFGDNSIESDEWPYYKLNMKYIFWFIYNEIDNLITYVEWEWNFGDSESYMTDTITSSDFWEEVDPYNYKITQPWSDLQDVFILNDNMWSSIQYALDCLVYPILSNINIQNESADIDYIEAIYDYDDYDYDEIMDLSPDLETIWDNLSPSNSSLYSFRTGMSSELMNHSSYDYKIAGFLAETAYSQIYIPSTGGESVKLDMTCSFHKESEGDEVEFDILGSHSWKITCGDETKSFTIDNNTDNYQKYSTSPYTCSGGSLVDLKIEMTSSKPGDIPFNGEHEMNWGEQSFSIDNFGYYFIRLVRVRVHLPLTSVLDDQT